jgi:hypothetical protein
MVTSFRPFLLAAALGLAAVLPGTAGAQQSYPRIIQHGSMDFEVDYGPMGQGNVVGGGRVMISPSTVTGETFTVMHLDMLFSQTPRPGFVPMLVGDAQNQSVIYVPAMMVEMVRRAMAGMRPAAAR